jgi:hypothetical protein
MKPSGSTSTLNGARGSLDAKPSKELHVPDSLVEDAVTRRVPRRIRQWCLRLASIGLVVAVPTALPASAAAADSCPNAEVRAQQSVSLPDCRAFELVSGDTNGSSILSGLRLSADTHGIAWTSLGAYADSRGVVGVGNYGALRDGTGWRVHSLSPAASDDVGDIRSLSTGSFVVGGDLLNAALWSLGDFTSDDPETGGGVSSDVYKVGLGGVATFVSHGQGFAANGHYEAVLDGLSDDPGGSTILFVSREHLTGDAPPDGATSNLYRWRDGRVDLVGVDEAGQPLANGAALGADAGNQVSNGGVRADAGRLADASMLSPDGTRFVYQSGGLGPFYGSALGNFSAPGALFLHVDGRPVVEITRSQRAGSVGDPAANGAKAIDASPDFKRVYFNSQDQLSDDAPSGGGVYVYDVATGRLSFVFRTPSPVIGDRTQGVVQISDDGQYIYFTSVEDLASGATAGAQNLYVKHGVDIAFVAMLGGSEELSAQPMSQGNRYPSLYSPASLDAAGDTLVFESPTSLAGASNAGHNAIYRYEAQTKQLSCISCRPSGAASQQDSSLGPNAPDGGHFAQSRFRNITDDGKAIVFSSADAILAQDTNGKLDVYEYRDGRVELLTTGRGSTDTFLSGASRDGADVFIITGDSLVKGDGDGGYTDVYDVRRDGGFLEADDPRECESSACQPLSDAVVNRTTPGSVGFASPGDPAVTRKPSCAAASTRVRLARAEVKRATTRYAKAKSKKAKSKARQARSAAAKRLKLYDSRLRSCRKGSQ